MHFFKNEKFQNLPENKVSMVQLKKIEYGTKVHKVWKYIFLKLQTWHKQTEAENLKNTNITVNMYKNYKTNGT